MGDQISWHVELAVKPGQIENFQALTGEMVESTRDEPGVLDYERFVSDDGKFVHVYERYADSAAAVAHLRLTAGGLITAAHKSHFNIDRSNRCRRVSGSSRIARHSVTAKQYCPSSSSVARHCLNAFGSRPPLRFCSRPSASSVPTTGPAGCELYTQPEE
jgi:quinol monooxygenase YgiN